MKLGKTASDSKDNRLKDNEILAALRPLRTTKFREDNILRLLMHRLSISFLQDHRNNAREFGGGSNSIRRF
jgi:hypothetical protein